MPRKAPKEVIEHRITLGDYERKMISAQLAEDDLIKKVQTGAEIGKTVLIGAGGIALGTLAVTAYREANDLVDTITDVPAGLWQTAKFKLGLISLDELVGSVSDDVEENKQESQDRKNKGVLEWGFEWLLKFLLGEDMIFTKATETNPDQDTDNGDNGDTDPYAPVNDDFNPNRYDPQDPYYSTSSDWYWHGALNHWMPITTYDDVYNPRPQPKPNRDRSTLEYWENLERTFCDTTSPDYDEDHCRDVQFDKLRAGF